MPVPHWTKFLEPLLRFLAQHPDGVLKAIADDAVADELELSESDRREQLPSGRAIVCKNNSGWALDRLKRARLATNPKRGFWSLTPEGTSYLGRRPEALTDQDIRSIVSSYVRGPAKEVGGQGGERAEPGRDVAGEAPPLQRLESALAEYKETVAEQILDRLTALTPRDFERVVIKVLLAMGYGGEHGGGLHTGAPNDGGIDGVISLDKLGLERVYIQAKKQEDTVGRPDIQRFYGALSGQRAHKGVFITTSSYSQQALEYAARTDKSIVLIDGVSLARHMLDLDGAGVSHEIIRLPRLDTDFFDETA